MITTAFFARLAQDHACALETRDMGEHGTFLWLRDGCGLDLPADLWRQYQFYLSGPSPAVETACTCRSRRRAGIGGLP